VEKNNIPVIKLLLSHPSIDLSIEIDLKGGNNAMHLLGHIHDHQVISRVMDKVNIINEINVLNKQHQTPLIISIMNNNSNYAEALLSFNADVNIYDSNGENCLTLACSYDYVDILRILLKSVSLSKAVNDKNEKCRTPIQTCALKQSNECALELLKLPNIDISNATHFAAKQGNSVMLKALLSYSSDSNVNDVDDNGSTALHLAAEKGDITCIEVLLSQPGILIDQQNNDGNTSLHMASIRGNSEAFHYLLSHGAGASLKIENNDKLKPLEVDVTKRLASHYSKQILHSTKKGNIAFLKGIVIITINNYLISISS
jgi:ankyrin repeat protein